MGIYSIVITTTVITTITSLITNPPYMAYCLKMKWYEFYPALLINIVGTVIMTVVFFLVTRAINPNGWIGLIMTAIFLCGIGFDLFYVCIFCKREEIYS